MNFYEFCNRENNTKTSEKMFDKSQTKPKEENQEKMKKDVDEIYEKYKNYSQNDLMNELLKQTAIKKEDGSLTNEKLDEIKTTLQPFLSGEQFNNLNQIIERLK